MGEVAMENGGYIARTPIYGETVGYQYPEVIARSAERFVQRFVLHLI